MNRADEIGLELRSLKERTEKLILMREQVRTLAHRYREQALDADEVGPG
jgi:hypothetical protein